MPTRSLHAPALRRLTQLALGQWGVTPDGLAWQVQAVSYTGPHTAHADKWVWLVRQHNIYRQVHGDDVWRLRLLMPAPGGIHVDA